MALPLHKKILQKNQQAAASVPQGKVVGGGKVLGLSAAVTCALGLALLAAVGWAFFMGYMVGRGEHPGRSVESVAGLLKPGAQAQEGVMAQEAQKPASQEAASAAETVPQEGAPEAARPATADQSQVQSQVQAQAQAQGQASAKVSGYPFNRPQGDGLAAWGMDKNAQRPAEGAKTPAGKPGAEPKQAKSGVQNAPDAQKAFEPAFDYQFQAAAFKGPTDAERLRNRLETAGFRARVRQSGKVRLVVVSLRGSEADARRVQSELAGLGLGKPILLEKKALADAKGGKSRAGRKP